MNWKYDTVLQEHQLIYGNSALAKVQVVPRKRGGVTVKTIISGIYFGKRKQEYMEKHNKEWVAYKKKFKRKEEATVYLGRKKIDVLKFIKAREKEA